MIKIDTQHKVVFRFKKNGFHTRLNRAKYSSMSADGLSTHAIYYYYYWPFDTRMRVDVDYEIHTSRVEWMENTDERCTRELTEEKKEITSKCIT